MFVFQIYLKKRLRKKTKGRLKRKQTSPRLPTYVVKDVRIFLNTIRHSLGLMQRAGVEADMQREDTEENILLTIRIPKCAKR